MQLSDHEIMAEVKNGFVALVTPEPDKEAYQPASLDLRLAGGLVDPYTGNEATNMVLEAGQFMLGSTIERLSLPGFLAAQVKGRSTWARRGLMVECAGFIDPGFEGQITLELKNLGHRPITLEEGLRVCQVAFTRMSALPARMYGDPLLGSHYQGQAGPTPARS